MCACMRVRVCSFILWRSQKEPPTLCSLSAQAIPPFEFPKPPSSPNLVNLLTQQGLVVGSPGRTGPVEQREPGPQAAQQAHCIHRWSEDAKGFRRSDAEFTSPAVSFHPKMSERKNDLMVKELN